MFGASPFHKQMVVFLMVGAAACGFLYLLVRLVLDAREDQERRRHRRAYHLRMLRRGQGSSALLVATTVPASAAAPAAAKDSRYLLAGGARPPPRPHPVPMQAPKVAEKASATADKFTPLKNKAVELGPLGMEPWGPTYLEEDTKNMPAKWIWITDSTKGLSNSDPRSVRFRKVISPMPEDCTIEFATATAANNIGEVFWNGKRVDRYEGGSGINADGSGNASAFSLPVNAGEQSCLEVVILNDAPDAASPAGFVGSARKMYEAEDDQFYTEDKALFVTDKSWTCEPTSYA